MVLRDRPVRDLTAGSRRIVWAMFDPHQRSAARTEHGPTLEDEAPPLTEFGQSVTEFGQLVTAGKVFIGLLEDDPNRVCINFPAFAELRYDVSVD